MWLDKAKCKNRKESRHVKKRWIQSYGMCYPNVTEVYLIEYTRVATVIHHFLLHILTNLIMGLKHIILPNNTEIIGKIISQCNTMNQILSKYVKDGRIVKKK